MGMLMGLPGLPDGSAFANGNIDNRLDDLC